MKDLTHGFPEKDSESQTSVKTPSGPEHVAPQNPEYTSSFDEYAGAELGQPVRSFRGGDKPAEEIAPDKEPPKHK